MRPDLAPSQLELEHRVYGSRASLRRAAGIQDPDTFVPLDLRHVRMPVDDRVAARKARGEPRLPPHARPRYVHHSDPRAAGLDDQLARKRLAEGGLVHVPEHCVHLTEPAKLVQHRGGHDVTRVQDQIRALEAAQALVRNLSRAPRQMRVGDDRDPGQRTTNGSLISVVDRSGFIAAANLIA
jgi:hypothetical protein